jgi:hypothetical protein
MRTVDILCVIIAAQSVVTVGAIALSLACVVLLRHQDALLADKLIPAWAKRWIEARGL